MQNTSDTKSVKVWYWANENAGDFVTPWIYSKLNIPWEYSKNERDVVGVGSVIEQALPTSKIWSAGLHNIGNKSYLTPANVAACRGEFTKAYFRLKDVALGDGGLCVTKFYKPEKAKKYKFGIVSHFTDYDDFKKVESDSIPVINMRTYDIDSVLDRMSECEFIFSSSLHGVIFAHALGIPAVHIINKPLISKNSFKFKDYYSVFKSISYVEDKWDPSLSFVSKYINEPEKYCPDMNEVEEIQNNLLRVLPYKERADKEIWQNLNL